MSETNDNQKDVVSFDTTMDVYLEKELREGPGTLEVGKIIQGNIVQITDSDVFVNIGYKAEGQVPIEEFDTLPKIGDTISVVALRTDIRNGGIPISYLKAKEKLYWKSLRDAFNYKTPVKGKITTKVNSGFEVLLDANITGFLPMSMVDVDRVDDPDKYINLETEFIIERLHKNKKQNILLSRRSWLEGKRAKKIVEFFEKYEVGDVVEGVVKNFVAFGVFIDLGGFDGLLHLYEIIWGHHPRPKSVLKKGETVSLKIIAMDKESEKISLSLKAMTENPWITFESRYSKNQRLSATVTKITDFGLFVELEPGIEGLVHYSELTWSRNNQKASGQFSIGQTVEVVILDFDVEAERISLSIKRTLDDPWYTIVDTYPVGKKMTGAIAKISQYGMFVTLDEVFDAFVPNEEYSWVDRGKAAKEGYEMGQTVEFIIIELDAVQRRIKASIRQLFEDPWVLFSKSYNIGDDVECVVERHNEHGLIVKAPFGLEGFIHRSQITNEPDKNIDELMQGYSVGDTLKAIIKEVTPSRFRLSLSIRDHLEMSKQIGIGKYLHDDSEDSTVRLGDYMK